MIRAWLIVGEKQWPISLTALPETGQPFYLVDRGTETRHVVRQVEHYVYRYSDNDLYDNHEVIVYLSEKGASV